MGIDTGWKTHSDQLSMISIALLRAQKCILLSLFSFAILFCDAQTNILSFDSSINLEVPSNGFYRQSLLSESFQGQLYFIKMNSSFPHKMDFILSEDNKLTIHSYNSIQKTTDSTIIQFDNLNNPKKDYLLSFSVSKTTIAFLINRDLYLYNKTDKSLSKQKLEYDYEKIKFVTDNTIILHTIYNYNDRDQKQKVVLTSYDIKTNASHSIFPQFKNIEFSSLVGNWITFSSNSILMSQSTEYKIIEYDFNLIVTRIITDSSTTIKAQIRTPVNNKNDFETLRNLDDSIERIVNIFTLDDSTFVIVRKTALGQDTVRGIDIWRKGKSYNKISSHLVPIRSIKNLDSINKKNMPLNFLLLNTNFYCIDKVIFELRSQYYPLLVNSEKTEYLQCLKDYRKKHPPTIGIKKYETNF
jgi:hypothetical protein